MKLKKLAILGFFALTLVACGGGSTSTDNSGVNPGGGANPPVVTPVASPVPSPVASPVASPVPNPLDGKADPEYVRANKICTAFDDFKGVNVCADFSVCYNMGTPDEACRYFHVIRYSANDPRHANEIIGVDLPPFGDNQYLICYDDSTYLEQGMNELYCETITVQPAPPPPAGGGNNGGIPRAGNDCSNQFYAATHDECAVDPRCNKPAYRAANPGICGGGAALAEKCRDLLFFARNWQLCKSLVVIVNDGEEAAPAGGGIDCSGNNPPAICALIYQLGDNSIPRMDFDLVDNDDDEPVIERCVIASYIGEHGRRQNVWGPCPR